MTEPMILRAAAELLHANLPPRAAFTIHQQVWAHSSAIDDAAGAGRVRADPVAIADESQWSVTIRHPAIRGADEYMDVCVHDNLADAVERAVRRYWDWDAGAEAPIRRERPAPERMAAPGSADLRREVGQGREAS